MNSFIKLQTNRRHYITQVDRHLTHNVLKAPSELGMIIRYIQLCDKKKSVHLQEFKYSNCKVCKLFIQLQNGHVLAI